MLKRIILILLSIVLLLVGCIKNENPTEEGPKQPRLITANSGKPMLIRKPKKIINFNRKKLIEYEIDSSTWTIKPLSENDSKIVLLTIDDAPDQYALEMAKILKKLEVPAIFFINGHFIDTDNEKEVLRKINELGFQIGNHTYTHTNLSTLSKEKQTEEIVSLNDEIEKTIGKKVNFFRAPFGVNTDISKEIVHQKKMIMMNWTYGYDWVGEYQNKDKLVDIMLNTPLLQDGAILLLHDRKWTYEALEEIVVGLRQKGYQFVDPTQIKGHP